MKCVEGAGTVSIYRLIRQQSDSSSVQFELQYMYAAVKVSITTAQNSLRAQIMVSTTSSSTHLAAVAVEDQSAAAVESKLLPLAMLVVLHHLVDAVYDMVYMVEQNKVQTLIVNYD
eukprot:20214-Heterococcus_DN1.PRE.4